MGNSMTRILYALVLDKMMGIAIALRVAAAAAGQNVLARVIIIASQLRSIVVKTSHC